MPKRVLHSPATAGRIVGVTPERIRQLCNAGTLRCVRDAAGRRFIPDSEIEKLIALRAEREQRAKSPTAERT